MLRFLLVVIVFAVTVYLVVRLMQERGPDSQQRLPRLPRFPARPQRPSRPVAPDDDDDFLRELERKRRHRQDPDG